MTRPYDIVIAGGGPAGVLAAARLLNSAPGMRIVLLDKESALGGRLRPSTNDNDLWNYGLSAISEGLYDFWDQTLKLDPDSVDLPSIIQNKQLRFGILAATKLSDQPLLEICSKQGARAIGGAAAARDWKNFDKAIEDIETGKKKDQAFSGLWSSTRKSPAAITLEHIGRFLGIPDVWSAAGSALSQRSKIYATARYSGGWQAALALIEDRLFENNMCDIEKACRIIGASYDDDAKSWTISTQKGQFTAPALIVAQPPWEALDWLPKTYWPGPLLSLAIKTKPTSVVVLTEKITKREGVDLPDVVIVPAESVQIMITPDDEICYQATLDYEISMQAPDVVKAIRRLKRASKKLHASVPELETSGERIALIPVGWAQPTGHGDRKWFEKLDQKQINSTKLAFCGDAYGSSFDGDDNLVESVLATANCFRMETSPRPEA